MTSVHPGGTNAAPKPPTDEERRKAAKSLSQCMVRLLLENPYFGGLAMQLDLVETDKIDTMATDGKVIYYSVHFVNAHTLDEIQGVIIHEVLHITYLHHLREGDRDHKAWNYVADAVINPIVVHDLKQHLPKDAIFVDEFKNLSVEQAYDRLPKAPCEDGEGDEGEGEGQDGPSAPGGVQSPPQGQNEAPGWGEVLPLKNEDGTDLTEAEKAVAEQEIKEKIVAAAERAKSIGNLPDFLGEYVEGLIKPKIDLYTLMAKAIAGDQPDQWTWEKPNRRYVTRDMYFPSQERIGCGDVLLSIDTSGSVSDNELRKYAGMMEAILMDYHPNRVMVVRHDAVVTGWEELEIGQPITGMKTESRGGTRIQPVFDWIEENGFAPDTMIGLTDLEICDFPDEQPPFKVLWVTTGADKAPWGTVVKLETE